MLLVVQNNAGRALSPSPQEAPQEEEEVTAEEGPGLLPLITNIDGYPYPEEGMWVHKVPLHPIFFEEIL